MPKLKIDEDLLTIHTKFFNVSYLDFVYKVNSFLEKHNAKTSYYKDAVRVFTKGGGSKTLFRNENINDLKKRFKLNNDLLWIALNMINELKMHLPKDVYDINIVYLKRTLRDIRDIVYKNMSSDIRKSKSEESWLDETTH